VTYIVGRLGRTMLTWGKERGGELKVESACKREKKGVGVGGWGEYKERQKKKRGGGGKGQEERETAEWKKLTTSQGFWVQKTLPSANGSMENTLL